MIGLTGITKTFDNTAIVDRFHLELDKYSITALVGPSGCGKSTILRIAAGLLEPDSGSVKLPHNKLGVVFQESRLLPWLTVKENLALSLSPRDPDSNKKIEQALRSVKLNNVETMLPNQLSGGMAQRVAIARALLRQPEVLLLDEPFSALDAVTRSELQRLLRSIATSHNVKCMLVTHDLTEAVTISDQIAVMGNGKVVAHYTKGLNGYSADVEQTIHHFLQPKLATTQ